MTTRKATTELAMAIVAVFVLACGGSDTPAPDGSADPDASPAELPAVCVWEPARDDLCVGSPETRRVAVCQGAPFEMILDLHCEYMSSVEGVGNVYCCP